MASEKPHATEKLKILLKQTGPGLAKTVDILLETIIFVDMDEEKKDYENVEDKAIIEDGKNKIKANISNSHL